MAELVHVGKIVNTHGIRGEVRVVPITDFAKERFAEGAQITVLTTPPTTLTITHMRQHKDFILLTFAGYDDINQVLPFKGQTIAANGAPNVHLEDNEFLYKDIIGIDIVDESGAVLGQVGEILSPGANDVWVVRRQGKKDLLLPYIHSVVLRVDVEHHQAVVDIPEGLDPEDAD